MKTTIKNCVRIRAREFESQIYRIPFYDPLFSSWFKLLLKSIMLLHISVEGGQSYTYTISIKLHFEHLITSYILNWFYKSVPFLHVTLFKYFHTFLNKISILYSFILYFRHYIELWNCKHMWSFWQSMEFIHK